MASVRRRLVLSAGVERQAHRLSAAHRREEQPWLQAEKLHMVVQPFGTAGAWYRFAVYFSLRRGSSLAMQRAHAIVLDN